MANLALRNPQYKSITIPATGVLSTVCTITIDGTLAYTINKNVDPSTTASFDVSELARDFLNITYSATGVVDYIDIVTVLTNRSLINGGGSTVGTATTFTDKGFEAYGIYTDEANPVIPFIGRSTPTFLLAKDVVNSSDAFEVFAPVGESGYVHSISSAGSITLHSYTGSSTSVYVSPTYICNITRIDCTKYGAGRKIIFINKFGVQQELWFFLKEVKTINRKNERYQSNTIVSASYDVENAPTKIFNTQAKQTYSLSSGYYPEFAVEYFEQLLLSEYIWMEVPQNESLTSTNIIPVTLKSSNIVLKTSVNDRLIEYTMEFEDAFDYINNIR